MTASGRTGSSRRTTVLALAVGVLSGVGVVAGWIAVEGGPQSRSPWLCSGCPPEIGIEFAQLDHVRAISGGFVCQFLLSPRPPPVVTASNISLRIFNLTTNVTANVLNVSLSFPNGTVIAYFHVSGSGWVTSTESEIFVTSVLTASSSTNLTGLQALLWDSATRSGASMSLA
jgi:hypothetical protein